MQQTFLVNTPLQRGVYIADRMVNRFNGFLLNLCSLRFLLLNLIVLFRG